MSDFQPKFLGLYDIDHSKDVATPHNISTEAEELRNWVITLALKIDKGNGKLFKFSSDSVEVANCMNRVLTEGDEDAAQAIANRLLRAEKIKQLKIGKLADIQRGSLLVLHFSLEGSDKFLLAKVDVMPILDTSDYKKHTGLPYEKHIFKTCLISLEAGEEHSLIVSDNVRTFSEYWWQDFLDSVELSSDEKNTDICFSSINSVLKRKLNANFKQDYTELFNDMVGYFRTKSSFDMDDFIENVIDRHEPSDEKIKLVEIKDKIVSLPESKGFDKSFLIVKEIIKAKFKRKIPLSDSIDLIIKNDVAKIASTITAFTENNRKYIRIESEEGYLHFSKLKNEENIEDEEDNELVATV